MEEKNRYFYPEVVFTFLLLLLTILTFRESPLQQKAYLISGLLSGFYIGWLIRNKEAKFLHGAITIGVIADIGWTVYSLVSSSFLYGDVVYVSLRGLFVLELIFSFGAWFHPFPAYIQVLSALLLMVNSALLKEAYDTVYLILIACYLAVWFFILRLKFYGYFKPAVKENKLYYVLSTFFIIIAVTSGALFSKFPLSQGKWPGIFKQDILEDEAKGPGGENDKLLYNLQDKIQEDITKMVFGLNSTEERQETLLLFSSLIKESPDTIELEKAEAGLIDRLKNPGPGLEKEAAANLAASIKGYVDAKIALNLRNAENNITKALRQQPFNMKSRFSVSSGVDKLRHGNKFKDIKEQQKSLRNSVNGSSLDSGTKTRLNNLIRKLKEWKSVDIYRKVSGDYDKQKDNLGQSGQKGIDDLVSKIKGAQDLAEFKEAGDQLESLRRETSSRGNDLVKKAQEMFELKMAMSLDAKNSKLKEGFEGSGMSEEELKKLKDALASLGDAEDYKDFSKEAKELKEKSEQENKDMAREERELLDAKAYQLAESKKQEIAQELEETSLSEAQKEDFLDTLESMDLYNSVKKLESDSGKLEGEIDKFFGQGLISSQAKDDLAQDVSDLGDVLSYQMELSRAEASAQGAAMEQWEEAVEETLLKEESKDTLMRLAAELSKADSLSEIREIQEAIENEIEGLASSGSWQQAGAMSSTGAASGTETAGTAAKVASGVSAGASGAGAGSVGASGSGVASGARSGVGRSSGRSGVPRGLGAGVRSAGGSGASVSGGGTTDASAASVAGSTSGSTGSASAESTSAGTGATDASAASAAPSASSGTGATQSGASGNSTSSDGTVVLGAGSSQASTPTGEAGAAGAQGPAGTTGSPGGTTPGTSGGGSGVTGPSGGSGISGDSGSGAGVGSGSGGEEENEGETAEIQQPVAVEQSVTAVQASTNETTTQQEKIQQQANAAQAEALKETLNPAVETRGTFITNQLLFELQDYVEEMNSLDASDAKTIDEKLADIKAGLSEEELDKKLNDLNKVITLKEIKAKEKKFNQKDLAKYKKLIKSIRAGLGKVKKKFSLTPKRKLAFIKVGPQGLKIHLGEKGKLKATGVYSDNVERNLTLLAEWVSLNDKVASVSKGAVYSRSTGEARVYARLRKIESPPVAVVIEEPRLISISLAPRDSQIPMNGSMELKAEGHFSDDSHRDIAALVNWEISDSRIIKLQKAKVEPKRFGETQVIAEYSGIRSLPALVAVIFTMEWLWEILAKWLILLMCAALLVLLILYFMTRYRAGKLAILYSDPRKFTIELYGNTRSILSIFGLKYKGALSPRSYAELVKKRYAMEEDLLLNFTEKFEEASYSRHVFGPERSAQVLQDYNAFLESLFDRHNRVLLFFKYCFVLMQRRPLFIKTQKNAKKLDKG